MKSTIIQNYKNLKLETSSKIYNIYFDTSFGLLKSILLEKGLNGRKFCVVTDSNVEKLYLQNLKDSIIDVCGEYSDIVFEAGEHNKNLDTIEYFYSEFLKYKLDRKSVVIALGGGVTGDMAGFAAATYMRGMNLIQIPTTLLSQVDSSVGGKTGVDYKGIKNIIGAFYQPDLVYINISTLKTLPKEQFLSGMGEVIKHGLICDDKYYNWISENKEKILSLDENTLIELVYRSCQIKSAVVSKDERETGHREILNFGHTFGHAIEALELNSENYDYKLPHGYCVVIGMCAALRFSEVIGEITNGQVNEIIELFSQFGLPTVIPTGINYLSAKNIYENMLLDKKTTDNKINLILLKDIGKAFIYKNADKEAIIASIKFII